ncbi:MAG: ATP citrate lyase citrate-binding domain-containing protein [candidate division KSB1 bacterium]|nr:ATP citrate lyase citrate-binding domain-containing protein [candidate division KSB1 bacterium]
MQITGLYYGSKLLKLVEFPVVKCIGSGVVMDEIQKMLDTSGKLVVKPIFFGGVGRKGKAGLIRFVDNLADAMKAKEDLYFVSHQWGGRTVRANGVIFEEYVPSEIEVYFSITTSTQKRKPIFTITPHGGVEVEELPPDKKKEIWIDPFIGIKSFDITNALVDTGCPEQYISPLVQHLPKLWALYDNYGLTTLEINPIRLKRQGNRWLPVACDFKAAFDQDNPAWRRLELPNTILQSELTPFESEINQLRTYQGQSDVLELNPDGSIIPFMFGGGANSAATETLGDAAIYSSDFGGNPPYDKMYKISRIVYKHWLEKASTILIIGGKANNTDIFVTFKGMFDALRDHMAEHGRKPVYVVVGRGGPNLIRGMFYAKDILDRLKLPYKMFGYDTSMIEVLNYALRVDKWWRTDGIEAFRRKAGVA